LSGTLDPQQLLAVADFLYCTAQLKKYLEDEEGPLAEFRQGLVPLQGCGRRLSAA